MKNGAKNKTKHYEYDIALGGVAVSMDLFPALHTNFDRFVGCRVRGCLEHGRPSRAWNSHRNTHSFSNHLPSSSIPSNRFSKQIAILLLRRRICLLTSHLILYSSLQPLINNVRINKRPILTKPFLSNLIEHPLL